MVCSRQPAGESVAADGVLATEGASAGRRTVGGPGGATTAAGSGAPRPCRRLGRYSARARGGGGARAWWPVWRSGLRLDLEDVEVDWLISVRW